MVNVTVSGEVGAMLDFIEEAARESATTSDVLAVPKAEQDLLKQVEDLRRGLEEVQQAGDKRVGDIVRIVRALDVMEGLEYETKSHVAECRKQVLRSCEVVERDLQVVGLCDKLEGAQESERWVLFDFIRKELTTEMQVDDEDEWDSTSEVWFDHPGESLQLPIMQFLGNASAVFCGYLWKKSPPPALPIKRWKWRWIVFVGGKIMWYASKAESCQRKLLLGEIDLQVNPCSVSMESVGTQFSIRPLAGKWIKGSFTGAAAGRAFYFDCRGSQHGRDQWVHEIKLLMRL